MSASISGGSSRFGSSKAATFWGVVFAILALAAIIAFYWGAQQKSQYEDLKNVSERQADITQVAGQLLRKAVQGRPLAFETLSDLDEEFSSNVALLSAPNATGNVVAPSAELEEKLGQFKHVLAEGLGLRGAVSAAGPSIRRLREQLPALSSGFENLTDTMKVSLAPAAQLHAASSEAILLRKVEKNLFALGSDEEAISAEVRQLGQQIQTFEQNLNGLLEGDQTLAIKRVNNVETRSELEVLGQGYQAIEQDFKAVSDVAPDLYKASVFARQLGHLHISIDESLGEYAVALDKHHEQADLIWKVGLGLGGLALLSLLLMVTQAQRDNKKQLHAIQEANQKSQGAILQLLDEMSTLADGDLTVEATVSEEITGAIADSVNYAIDEMRKLVQAINLSSVRVENTAKQTQSTTLELSESSKEQANQIERVSEAIEDLNRSIDKVSQNAEDSAEVAESSVNLAQKGVRTVRGTIEGMDVIRERIQDTSKRIKRLGESSQEIGDIVGLITDIADQTNILALNAAIQASAAGEGGRGFAVVADEVQRLAERSSNASKQIEALVKTIQADTNEAVQSMEQSTSHVVRGANLAEDSGRALEEIESVSNRLARLITDISSESREQAILSDSVTELMGSIQRITGQTVAGTNDTALAVGELVEQSRFLKQSVEGFKLSDELEELDVDILDIETEETEVAKPDDESMSLTS